MYCDGLLLVCVWPKMSNKLHAGLFFYIFLKASSCDLKPFSFMSHIIWGNLSFEVILFLTDDWYIFSICDTFIWPENKLLNVLLVFVLLPLSAAADWRPHVAGIILCRCYLVLLLFTVKAFLLSCRLFCLLSSAAEPLMMHSVHTALMVWSVQRGGVIMGDRKIRGWRREEEVSLTWVQWIFFLNYKHE